MSHFHVIDSEHVPLTEQESYKEISTRIEQLCDARSNHFSAQSDRLNAHHRLSTQMRRLEDDIIVSLADKVSRVRGSLNVENSTQNLSDIQVSHTDVCCLLVSTIVI